MFWLMFLLSFNLTFHKLEVPQQILTVKDHLKLIEVIPKVDSMPSDSSQIYLGYTKDGLVFYVRMWQKEGINASSRKRDSDALFKQAEDAVYFFVSTTSDRRNAYYIGVNPLGTILDKIYTSNGITEWDANIKVKTHRKSDYWDAFVFVPFKNLSYTKSPWGLQVMRVISKNAHIQLLYPTKELSPRNTLSFELDFNYIKKTRDYNLYFVPSTRIERNPFADKTYQFSSGFTTRFKKGSGDLLDFTYKPDFSEVEADIIKVDISRLPVNYPEKRPFFVEGKSILNLPIGLIRTRNLAYPNYGLKFYSVSDMSAFGIWYVDDDSLGTVSFTRIRYSPSKNLSFGTFLDANSIGYNVVSGDIFYALRKYSLTASAQFSRRLDQPSNLLHFAVNRNPIQGFLFRLEGSYIDSAFISPLNMLNLYFDGVKSFFVAAVYKKFSENNRYFGVHTNYSVTRDLYDNTLVRNRGMLYFSGGKLPYLGGIGYITQDLGYLRGYYPETRVNLLMLALAYQISAWKNMYVEFYKGRYLGGDLKKVEGGFAVSLYGVNLGFKLDYFKSNYDDKRVAQVYGEIPLPYKVLLKPYLNYTDDRMLNKKKFQLNGILAYEPSAFSGIYLAINRRYEDEGMGFDLKQDKEVFKVQLGVYLIR